MSEEVENTLQRINHHPGVLGIIVAQGDGKSSRCLHREEESPVARNKDNYSIYCTEICSQARSAVRDLDPVDDLRFLRIRTKKVEIMLTPEKDNTIICVQDPSAR
ncbi:MAG: putative dynein light chain roadblock-type 2 [Streblomastix strix]|uniref:Dynein light chain roadblock n=1 Tax=Streblomastix strix TaxID=222440 RepID=A0A5J4V1H4_9EUKA|nr:MAG: putative dynein light chain roadblock-type 2 [Streblomastix strix]